MLKHTLPSHPPSFLRGLAILMCVFCIDSVDAATEQQQNPGKYLGSEGSYLWKTNQMVLTFYSLSVMSNLLFS